MARAAFSCELCGNLGAAAPPGLLREAHRARRAHLIRALGRHLIGGEGLDQLADGSLTDEYAFMAFAELPCLDFPGLDPAVQRPQPDPMPCACTGPRIPDWGDFGLHGRRPNERPSARYRCTLVGLQV